MASSTPAREIRVSSLVDLGKNQPSEGKCNNTEENDSKNSNNHGGCTFFGAYSLSSIFFEKQFHYSPFLFWPVDLAAKLNLLIAQ